MSKVKDKITLTIQASTIIIGVLLLSTMWLVLPSAISMSIPPLLPQAAFATTTATCDGQPATIVGTSGADNIVGTPGRDVIAALAGSDRVQGLGGNDLICGGSGNDQISGGDGNDRMLGESGNDEMNGDAGTDQLVGNSGRDRANGGAGSDICSAETETSCDEPPDTTPPVITVPEDITVVDTDRDGSEVVRFEVSAVDDVDGSVEVTCDPNSGGTFPVGETVVTCSAEDAAGNTATGTFTVTVTQPPDTTAPTITVPEDITEEATSADGAVVTFEVSAVDDVDGQVEVSCTPASGSTFPIGTTTVTCTATDAAGNIVTASFTVTVNPPPDTTPPTLDVPDSMIVFAPSTAPIVVTWEVTAQDNVDGTATLNEDNTLTQDNVGGDITIACSPPSGSAFSVGVNRHGVVCTATDEAGNTAEATFGIETRF